MTWDEAFMGIKSMARLYKDDLISPALAYLTDARLQGFDPPDEVLCRHQHPVFAWKEGKVKTRIVIDNPLQATIITVNSGKYTTRTVKL